MNPVFADLTKFTILVVCTGNICRSPLAEWLLAKELALGDLVTVVSAGTSAMVSHDAPDEIWKVAAGYGVNRKAAHFARQLSSEMIADADLILSATREHRADVARLYPKSAAYSFTLRQFARLVGQLETPFASEMLSPVLALRAVVAEVAANRGAFAPPVDPSDDDVADPFRRSVEDYARAGRQIHDAVATISTVCAQSIEGGVVR